MLRLLKQVVWLAGIVAGCQSAFGFALIGPAPASGNPDDFQIPAIGYENGLGTITFTAAAGFPAGNITGSFTPGGDMGTPKAAYPYQGYRRNTPVLYYSFDSSFLHFFGTNGAGEVDKALAVYNNLANVSAYSQDLSEFPTETRRVNYRAAADLLQDVKSEAMGMMTEQLGFWQPVRWVWCLHDRQHIGTVACPADMFYSVIKRNYDLVPSALGQYQSSSYVNDVLYSYEIFEGCNTSPLLADAVEFPVDPLADAFSAVADYTSLWYLGLQPGTFYTGLTRDDVGGLRYLIRSNNVAVENAGVWTIEFETNAPAILTNQDLNLFTAQAATNPPAALLALYPGLIIDTVNTTFGLTVTTNITEVLTNSPYFPAGAAPTIPVLTTNYTTNVTTFYQYTFANLITNGFSTRGLVGSVFLGLTNSPYAPAGTPPTVVTNTRMRFVNGTFGTFYLLPTNSCEVQILSNIFTQVIATTNPPTGILTLTNTAGAGTTTSNTAIVFTPGTISFFTNQTLVYLPITCPTNTPAIRQGIEKIGFIRRDYDSLISQFWDPVTNDYTLVELDAQNGEYAPRRMERVVLRPDFLYSAADLAAGEDFTYSNTIVTTNFSGSNILTETLKAGIATGPGVGEFSNFRITSYDESQRSGNLAGPGTITSPYVLPTLFVFNEVGPFVLNSTVSVFNTNLFFIPNEGTQYAELDTGISWGSYDGTTNAPTVYPNGTSITNLESLLAGPFIVTSTLPVATVGAAYSAQLSATGGQPPYTWSLSPGSAGLPPGLDLTTDSNGNAQITGTPTGPGGGTIYDFSIRVTDLAGAYKDQAFTITVF